MTQSYFCDETHNLTIRKISVTKLSSHVYFSFQCIQATDFISESSIKWTASPRKFC